MMARTCRELDFRKMVWLPTLAETAKEAGRSVCDGSSVHLYFTCNCR